ncbi:MAG: hypothetical protein HYX84_08365 [Chloroflexi bacterium]|nr:hypothetical protein [Chloroflexota bacterium]
MDWKLWSLILVLMGMRVASLVIDRIFGLQARRLWLVAGIPGLIVFGIAIGFALVGERDLVGLVLWGALAGFLGTVLLDAVRLVGVRLGAFPLDMPEMFGMIALGLAPRLQRNMMKEVVAQTATLPEAERRGLLEARLKAIARMPGERRQTVMKGMMAGLAELSEARRQSMLQTQMSIMTELPAGQRRALMAAMDKAMAETNGNLPYAQPRGMPRIPMATFRQLANRAMPRTQKEAGCSLAKVRFAGYLWHFVIGITFGISYTMLFGQGSWGLAIFWGIFIWLTMMVLMPPMMPMIRFPGWFPGVPLIAHVVMVVPFGLISLYLISDVAHLHSLLGALVR